MPEIRIGLKDEMVDSRWYRQVTNRADRLVEKDARYKPKMKTFNHDTVELPELKTKNIDKKDFILHQTETNIRLLPQYYQ